MTMKDLIAQHITTRCEVVVEEKNLTAVLGVLNRHGISSNLTIGDCCWREGNMWYIAFRVPGKKLTAIRNELERRNFNNIMILTYSDSRIKVEKLG